MAKLNPGGQALRAIVATVTAAALLAAAAAATAQPITLVCKGKIPSGPRGGKRDVNFELVVDPAARTVTWDGETMHDVDISDARVTFSDHRKSPLNLFRGGRTTMTVGRTTGVWATDDGGSGSCKKPTGGKVF